MTVLLVVAVVLLVTMFISGLVVLAISHSRRMERFWSEHRQNWTNIARELGLTYDPNAGVGSYGMIEGVYHGVWVRIDVYTSGGDNSHTTTRVRSYHHPQLNLKLNIRRETSLGTLGRALGLRDIETGDAAFDQAFHVEGNDPDAVVRLLDGDVRRHILHYESQIGSLQLDDHGVTGRISGRATHLAHVLPLVRAQVGLILAMRRCLTAAQVEDPAHAHTYVRAS